MSAEREKILRYYRASGDDALAGRLLDSAEAVLKNQKYKISEFLDPYGFSIAETIAAHFDRLELVSEGGYSGAERVKAAFVGNDFPGTVDFSITALSVLWDKRFYQISHRDVLGALMGLSLKREVIGDIIMIPEGCQIVVDSVIAPFIKQNLTQVGAAPISVTTIELTKISPREEKIKDIKTTVASLRLDVVAASGFGTSRSKMASEITAQKLKVNWQDAKNAAQTVKVGDIISMRGRGRVEVCEILGQTKKGRISILLKRFI